ncbi:MULTISPECIES: SecY-interacting protein Syd [Pseudobutyrivibrio]|nr:MULTISPECIES: SecY-interacting protein Syd [Pseudobutyrivibrio]SCX89621.1 Syd protein (SUKH-2) [Pseudobutyrivibrio sp. AR14]
MINNALESYFKKLNVFFENEFGSLPTVSYTDRLNKKLVVSEPDEDYEVEWQPKEQAENIDWNEVEEKLGFTLCEELKNYYSAYSFLMMAGDYKKAYLDFTPIDATESVVDTIKKAYRDGSFYFPNKQVLLIGGAEIGNNDDYFIFYDNETGKVFCLDDDTKKEVALADTLEEIIAEMEAGI